VTTMTNAAIATLPRQSPDMPPLIPLQPHSTPRRASA
jgi:hypothetical protein